MPTNFCLHFLGVPTFLVWKLICGLVAWNKVHPAPEIIFEGIHVDNLIIQCNEPLLHTYYCVTQWFSQVWLLGRFDSERISKSVLRLFSTARTNMRIKIAVCNQCTCIFVGWRLRYSGGNNNKVYIIMIVNFCVILHYRRRWGGPQW